MQAVNAMLRRAGKKTAIPTMSDLEVTGKTMSAYDSNR